MIDRRLKLRHVQCFLAVWEHQGVMAAAEALAISQPAISKTLRELEEIVGIRLMERDRTGVRLTDPGELFRHYASASVAALSQGLEGVAQRGRQTAAITLRIGALPTVAARLAPRAVHLYKQSPAAAVVRLVTGGNEDLLTRLRAGDLDLVLGRLAVPHRMADLTFQHLYSERVVIAVRPGHPLLAGRISDLSALSSYTVLVPTPEAVIRRSVDEALMIHGAGPLIDRIETVSNAFGRTYVRDTDAVWIISEGVVARDLEEGVLALLPFRLGNATGPVGITLRAGTEPAPPLRVFMDAVRACAKGMAAGEP